MDKIRRSQAVTLTVIGLPVAFLVGINALPAGTEMRRNLYADRAGCERDYSASQCDQNTSGGGSSGHGGAGGGRWRGPEYAADRTSSAATGDPGPGRVGVHSAVVTSVRGGFGGFARSAHASS